MPKKMTSDTPETPKKPTVVIPQRQRTPIEMQTGPRLSGMLA